MKNFLFAIFGLLLLATIAVARMHAPEHPREAFADCFAGAACKQEVVKPETGDAGRP